MQIILYGESKRSFLYRRGRSGIQKFVEHPASSGGGLRHKEVRQDDTETSTLDRKTSSNSVHSDISQRSKVLRIPAYEEVILNIRNMLPRETKWAGTIQDRSASHEPCLFLLTNFSQVIRAGICEPIGMHTRKRHIQTVFKFCSRQVKKTIDLS